MTEVPTVRLSAIRLGVLLVWSGTVAPPAFAQQAQVPRGPQADQMRMQIAAMEGVLERAVGQGILATRSQIPDFVSVPFPMLSGSSRARGFRIEGYGVFFDVEVPRLPQSMLWSMQVIARSNDAAIMKDLGEMRALAAKVSDEKTRAEMQQQINKVELRISGLPPGTGTAGGMQRVSGGVSQPVPVKSPDEIYTEEVKNALVRAILDQAGEFQLAPDEWLTVAALDSEGASRMPALGESNLATMYFSVQGKTLAAIRSGQINRDEARKSIRITYF